MSAELPAECGNAFARHYRLTKTDEYSSVFGFRRAIRGQLLMLHYGPRADATGPRLGLVVGKKQIKSAVRRNRVKRVMREQFRLHRAELPPWDLVVRVVTRPQRLDRRELAAEIVALFGKLPRRLPAGDVK